MWFHNGEERTQIFTALKRITSTANENTTSQLTSQLSNLLQSSNSLKLLQKQSSGGVSSADTAASDSKEAAQKLKYSEIVSKTQAPASPNKKNSAEESRNISGNISTEVSSPHSPPSSSFLSTSDTSTAKKNLLLSALKSPAPVATITATQSQNSLDSLMLLSALKVKTPENVVPTSGTNGPTAKSPLVKSVSTSQIAGGSNGTVHGSTVNGGSGGVDMSGTNRLMSLLKATGRDVTATGTACSPTTTSPKVVPVASPLPTTTAASTPAKSATTASVANANSALTAKLRAAISVSPNENNGTGSGSGQNIPPVVPSPAELKSGAVLTAEERSNKLLGMLRHATTSTDAMDLLTDGDIAQKTCAGVFAPKSPYVVSGMGSRQSPVTIGLSVSPVPPSAAGVSSAEKLFSMLKSNNGVSAPQTPPTHSAVTVRTATSGALSTTTRTSPTQIPPTRTTTTTQSSVSSGGAATVKRLLASPVTSNYPPKSPLLKAMTYPDAARDSIYLRSPELKGFTGSSVAGIAGPASSVKLVRPVLLSPSDLLRLAV